MGHKIRRGYHDGARGIRAGNGEVQVTGVANLGATDS